MAESQSGMISPGSQCTDRTGTHSRAGAFLKTAKTEFLLRRINPSELRFQKLAAVWQGGVGRAVPEESRGQEGAGRMQDAGGRMLPCVGRAAWGELAQHLPACWLAPASVITVHPTSVKVSHKMIN